MNKQPVSYLQKDPRWKDKPYRVSGENSTVGSAGCGPSCAAMVIETLTGQTFTPEDACNWSVQHGYKALKQGTYYIYFKPQLAAFGIQCDMLNWTNTYGKPNHSNHKKALDLLKEGYYLIALMGKGTWTSSGHFILVWWADDAIHINDPNSTRADRVQGDPYDFRSQVKYYWWVDARAYNAPPQPAEKEEDEDMTELQVKEICKQVLDEQRKERQDNDCGSWSKDARNWATSIGLISGGGTLPDGQPNYMWADTLTREQAAALFYRFAQMMGKA